MLLPLACGQHARIETSSQVFLFHTLSLREEALLDVSFGNCKMSVKPPAELLRPHLGYVARTDRGNISRQQPRFILCGQGSVDGQQQANLAGQVQTTPTTRSVFLSRWFYLSSV